MADTADREELERLIVRLVGDGSSYLQMCKEATQATKTTANEVKKGTKEIEVFGKTIDNLGTTMTGFAGSMLAFASIQSPFGFLKDSVQEAAKAESMQKAFGVMLQSAKAGTAMVADLQKFAAETPLEMGGIQSAAKMLLQFGVEANNIIPTIRMLGDVAMGDQQKLMSLALAFGQAKGAGRLMGGEMLQMIGAGFNPLQEIARTTGKSVAELRSDMEDGKITVQMLEGAFKSATSEGGRFKDGMKEASTTLEGLTSTMGDDINALKRALGEAVIQGFELKEMVKGVSEQAQGLTNWFTGLNSVIKGTVITVAAIAAGFGILVATWKVGSLAVGMIIGVLKHAVISFRSATVAVYAYATAARTATAAQAQCNAMLGMMPAAAEKAAAATRAATVATVAFKAGLYGAIVYGVGEAIYALAGGNKAMKAFNDEIERGNKLTEQQIEMNRNRNAIEMTKVMGISDIKERVTELKKLEAQHKKELEGNERALNMARQAQDQAKGAGTWKGAARDIMGGVPLFGRGIQAENKLAEDGINQATKFHDATKAKLKEVQDELKKIEQAGMMDPKLQQDHKEFLKALNLSIKTFGMSADEAKLYEMVMRGLPQAEADAARGAIGLKAALEATTKSTEAMVKAAEDAAEAHQKLMEEGRRVTEGVMPIVKFNNEIDKLAELMSAGAISEEVFNLATAEANRQLQEATKSAKTAKNEVQALNQALAGSAEGNYRIQQYLDRNYSGRGAVFTPSSSSGYVAPQQEQKRTNSLLSKISSGIDKLVASPKINLKPIGLW